MIKYLNWKLNLSSSALGDNRMATIPMEGRVVIDMLKVVQRDHNLDISNWIMWR